MTKITVFLLFISFVTFAEDSYIVLTGQCTLKDSFRNEYGRVINNDLAHDYISYPAKFDTEKYTTSNAEKAYGVQITKKHNKFKTGGFHLGMITSRVFDSKKEANEYYKELRKNKRNIKMNLSTTELKKSSR